MAYVRVRKIKGYYYLYLYTTHRVGGRPRSKYIAYLGRAGRNVARRLPKKHRKPELLQRVQTISFRTRLDEVLQNRREMLVRLG